jgi:hypothetical protein
MFVIDFFNSLRSGVAKRGAPRNRENPLVPTVFGHAPENPLIATVLAIEYSKHDKPHDECKNQVAHDSILPKKWE